MANTQSPDSNAIELLPPACCRGDLEWFPARVNFPLPVPPELSLLLIACLLWSGLHFLWCARGSISPFRSYFELAYFAPLGEKQHPVLIAFGSFLPAAAAVTAAATCGLWDYWTVTCPFGAYLGIWSLVILVASALACRENFQLPLLSPGLSGKNYVSWRRWVAAVSLAVFAVFTFDHYYIALRLTDENRIPAYWRNAHVLNGVSALLPQLILLAGLYLWFWFSLRGLALFGDDRPLLPKLWSLPKLESLPKDSLPNDSLQTDSQRDTARKRTFSVLWSYLRKLALFGRAASSPTDTRSLMPMFSHEWAAEPTEHEAKPLGTNYLLRLLLLFMATGIVFQLVLQDHTLRTIGERKLGLVMFLGLSLSMAIILADTVQLWTTWRNLRELLVYLDRLCLRRTLRSLPGLSWNSVWTLSGNTLEERYRLISLQFESLTHLKNRLDELGEESSANVDNLIEKGEARDKVEACLQTGKDFAKWFVRPEQEWSVKLSKGNTVKPLQDFQVALAETAGSAMTNLLVPAWQKEKESLILDKKHLDPKPEDEKEESAANASPALPGNVEPYVRAAEEFFVLPYLGFIQNILGRMRTIILGSLFLFVATTLAVSSYPFDPLPVLGGVFIAVFAITGGTVIIVFAQMHRDATLSHITNTRPDELGSQFWIHIITFGIGPLLGLLTTLFPSITDFVTSWLQPGAQALQ